ncbi:Uncharacterised protein [Bordetella pertussis]|nr:Uncharacterised protein [Bordetella pertussis]
MPSPRAYSLGVARYLWRESGVRPSVDTTRASGGRKAPATPMALVSRPPGSLRRSSTRLLGAPLAPSSFRWRARSGPVFSWNCAMRR